MSISKEILKMKKLSCALAILLSFTAIPAYAFTAPAKQCVVDSSHLINASDLSDLNHQVELLNQRTGKKFAALILPSLNGQSVEAVTQDVYDQWHLKDGKSDQGVLIVIATDDYMMRIQTGDQAERDITNDDLQKVVDQDLKPKLYLRDFAGALRSSFNHMGKLSKTNSKYDMMTSTTSAYIGSYKSSDPYFALLAISVGLVSALLFLLFIKMDNRK